MTTTRDGDAQQRTQARRRYVVIDFETTGFSPAKGDRAIEVAAVEITGGKIGNHFASLMNPGRGVSGNITEITGISNEMISKARPSASVMKEFAEFTEGAILIAHNARFDIAFLKSELELIGIKQTNKVYCTMVESRKAFPGADNYKLATICEHVGITATDGSHRALADSLSTAKLFFKIDERLKLTHEEAIVAEPIEPPVALNPSPASVHYNNGNAYDAKGDHDRAIADYTEAIRVAPKVERLHGIRFDTRRLAKDEVIDWITFYNHRRLHSTLGYASPMAFERKWLTSQISLAA